MWVMRREREEQRKWGGERKEKKERVIVHQQIPDGAVLSLAVDLFTAETPATQTDFEAPNFKLQLYNQQQITEPAELSRQ